MMEILLWLLVGHAVADYPLQGDFLAKARNHRQPIPGVPWFHGLLWHSVMHGGAVALATGSALLGTAEVLCHAAIDHAKCAGALNWTYSTSRRRLIPTDPRLNESFTCQAGNRFAFHVDQALHVACKVAWAAIAVLA